jgi:hypothetical protein
LSVSKKVVGDAVHRRNRIRRLYRAASVPPDAARIADLGLDLVLVPRRGDEPSLGVIQSSLVKRVPSGGEEDDDVIGRAFSWVVIGLVCAYRALIWPLLPPLLSIRPVV